MSTKKSTTATASDVRKVTLKKTVEKPKMYKIN